MKICILDESRDKKKVSKDTNFYSYMPTVSPIRKQNSFQITNQISKMYLYQRLKHYLVPTQII